MTVRSDRGPDRGRAHRTGGVARRPTRGRTGLDQPKARGWSPRGAWDPDLFGRASERIARYIGSWAFIAWMTVVVVAWIGWNTVAPEDLRPDPFPFIFLTLLLSLQASYAAPLILLAQNRQADRDRVQYQEDRARTDRLIADTEYLTREVAGLRMALGDVTTRDYLRGELRDLLDEIEQRLTPPSGPDAGRAGRGRRMLDPSTNSSARPSGSTQKG